MGRYVLIAIVLAVGCKKGGDSGPGSGKAPVAPPVKVTTVVAAEAPTPEVLVLTGTIAADQRSDVTADTQGKVINVMIERGQRVKFGQPVVQLDVRNAALGAREAQANLESARAQKQLAEEECKRTKALMDKGAITASEYDRQMTQCSSSLQQVAAAQARTEMMAKSVSDGIVRAPYEGVIAERMVSPGEWVQPGKPLFTLVKDDPLKIELSVPEVALSYVKDKERVQVRSVAFPDKTFWATVNRIGAEIGKTRSLIVEAQLDKDSGLVPGMFAEADLVVGEKPHVVLPKDAVVERNRQQHVFVVTASGEAEDRIVQTSAPPSPDQVAITHGIAKGEKVVAKVTDQVTDGVKVTE